MYVYIKHIYKPICNYVYLHTYKNIGVQNISDIANGIPWFLILLSLRYSTQQYLKLHGKHQQTFAKFPFQAKVWNLLPRK